MQKNCRSRPFCLPDMNHFSLPETNSFCLPEMNDITPGNLKTKSRRNKDAITYTTTTNADIIASAMNARTERIHAEKEENKTKIIATAS